MMTLLLAGVASVTLQYGIKPHQTLDFYRSPTEQEAQHQKVVVFAHPGGWVSGSPSDVENGPLLNRFLKAGVSVASVNYELGGKYPSAELDFEIALRYLKAYTQNKSLVGWGVSAGGYIVAHNARLLDAIIIIAAPLDLNQLMYSTVCDYFIPESILDRDKADYWCSPGFYRPVLVRENVKPRWGIYLEYVQTEYENPTVNPHNLSFGVALGGATADFTRSGLNVEALLLEPSASYIPNREERAQLIMDWLGLDD